METGANAGFSVAGTDVPGSSPLGTRRFTPPLRIPNGLGAGQSFNQTVAGAGTQDYAAEMSQTEQLRFLGIETVMVPTGTLPNCINLAVTNTGKNASGQTLTSVSDTGFIEWFAPGIGLVKSAPLTGNAVVQELTSYHVGSRSGP